MKPIRHDFSVAEKVRRAIQRLNRSTKLQQRGHFGVFDNCREQGFVLQVFGPKLKNLNIAFSENRNSDDIVVYCYDEVAFPSNLPIQWDKKRYFEPTDVEGAARHVLKLAVGFLNKKKRP